MPTTTLTTSQAAFFDLSAAGADESPRPAGFSAAVSDYAKGYVALLGLNRLYFVSKGIPGVNSITISGHSQDGTALPDRIIDFNVTSPPVPQATHFVIGDISVVNQDITTPGDPGTDTVTGGV